MTKIHLGDENLMAYADGEADAALRQAVEDAMLEDPAVVRRVVSFLRSRQLARAALAGQSAAVPDRLRAAVDAQIAAFETQQPASAEVVPLKRRRVSDIWARVALPVAASAVLFAGLSVYAAVTAGQRDEGGVSLVAGIEGPRVQKLLNVLPAGAEVTEDDVTLRALATYRLPSGRICRSFSLTQHARGAEAVSCREGQRWVFTVANALQPNAYVPADGSGLIAGYLSGVQAGEPMSREEETRLFAELEG